MTEATELLEGARDHALGNTPSRSTGSVILSCGLLQVALETYAGSDDGVRVSRKKMTRDGHEVGMRAYDKITGQNLSDDDIILMAPSSIGQLVELTDEEQAAATTVGVDNTSELISFIPEDALGRTYLIQGVNQVRPMRLLMGKKKVDNPATIKAFALLRTVMAERKVAALFQYKTRGPVRYGAVTADGRLLTPGYAEELRPGLPLPDVELSGTERAMGEMLLDAIGIDLPVLTDTASADIQRYVDAKAEGQPLPTVAEVPSAVPEAADLLAVLQASIDATKAKRAAKTNATEPAAPAKKTSRPRKTAAETGAAA
jgi:DNA end-binding protein Ku